MRNNNFNNKNGRTKYVKLMIYLTFLFILIQLSEELHTRKNQKNMSKIEIEKFVNAVKELKSNGIYDEFVRVHGLSFPTERISTPIFYFECIELLAPSPPEQNPNWFSFVDLFKLNDYLFFYHLFSCYFLVFKKYSIEIMK